MENMRAITQFLPANIHPARLALRVLSAIILLLLAYYLLPVGIDWQLGFRPAAQAMLSGESPYETTGSGFFNPPWVMVLLIPLALLPAKLGSFLLTIAGFLAYFYMARRAGASILGLAVFIFSPPVMLDLGFANITWLVLLGYFLPPQIGLFFVLLKPHVGIGVAIFWLFEAWQKGKFRQVIHDFWPISIALILSIVVYGWWFLKPAQLVASYGGNVSFWPLSIPFGVVLLVRSIVQRNIQAAYMVGPFLSPYLTIYSWQTVLMALLPRTVEITVAVASAWLIYLYMTGHLF